LEKQHELLRPQHVQSKYIHRASLCRKWIRFIT